MKKVRVNAIELAIRSMVESAEALFIIYHQTNIISVRDEAVALLNTAKFLAALNNIQIERVCDAE